MKRRIDEFRWHCGPHRCEHEAEDLALTWRYSVVSRDFAVSLCVSKSGADFLMHLAPASCKASARRYAACDLLEAGCDVPHPPSSPPPLLGSLPGLSSISGLQTPPAVSPALVFWSEHAVGGALEQPERFWRALERRAKAMVAEVRRGRYRTMACPRCQGKGTIELKPRKK